LIDRNRIQGIGKTEEVMALEPLDTKLRSFGFFVATADGHDFNSLADARKECEGTTGVPRVIICNTVKGHGISFMQNTVDWHYLPMKESQYERSLAELGADYQKTLERYK
jgi:transketolase